MSKSPWNLKQTDVERMIKAAEKRGYRVVGIEHTGQGGGIKVNVTKALDDVGGTAQEASEQLRRLI